MQEEFDKYVSNYDMSNLDILLKYNHSYRVMRLQEKYAKLLGWNEEDVELAKIIGLLHDIGRFEQLKVYNTYNDLKSIDHADYSVEQLFDKNEIIRFCDKKEWYPIIKFAVISHNQWHFKKCDDERMNMHAMLIRDTDKLDILYLVGTLKDTNLYPDDSKVSEKVKEGFWKHMLIDNRNIKTHNDDYVVMLAYPFDIYGIVHVEMKKLFENIYM